MKITDLPGMKEGSTIRNIAVGGVYAFVFLMVLGAMAPAEDTDNSGASEAEAETDTTDAPDDTETETAKADGGTETEQPAEETETEAPEGESSGDGYQVRVSYDGEWSGSFGSMGEGRTVDGSGAETVDIDMEDETLNMVSATVQKLEAGDGEMTVQILNGGEVVEEKSTSAEHGVVTISYET